MPGRDPIPSNDDASADAGADLPVLPATVSANHLRACAAGLADATTAANARHGIGELGALAEVLSALVDGQRHLATTLANLTDRIATGSANGALAAAAPSDLRVLREILAAASSAAGHTADALAESTPAVETLLDAVGSDTRLT